MEGGDDISPFPLPVSLRRFRITISCSSSSQIEYDMRRAGIRRGMTWNWQNGGEDKERKALGSLQQRSLSSLSLMPEPMKWRSSELCQQILFFLYFGFQSVMVGGKVRQQKSLVHLWVVILLSLMSNESGLWWHQMSDDCFILWSAHSSCYECLFVHLFHDRKVDRCYMFDCSFSKV